MQIDPAPPLTSLEIAQQAQPEPIEQIALRAGLEPDEIELYGRYKAKVSLDVLDRLRDRPDGRLVCVTSMTPTSTGEGKTTTLIGLAQGLAQIGVDALACLREPSIGPVFGIKGGAAGGGRSQVIPMEDINLHFTGDMHAISAANNLLAAMLDASLQHGNPLRLDLDRITWRRALDMNDRALRNITIGQGRAVDGVERQTGFDITAACEVMALLAVSRDLHDLRQRLGAITVGYDTDGRPVTAEDLGAAGAMAVLLKEAVKPNLVQTLEGQPVLMHCGPFANIAHGNNSLIADRVALKLADVVVTESGFGSDMGFEKLLDIVCPAGGLTPSAAVLVVSAGSVKHHGGVAAATGEAAITALEAGMANVRRHLEIVETFGLPCVVAINRRPGDADEELAWLRERCLEAGALDAQVSDGFQHGGAGTTDLARAVMAACDAPSRYAPLYAPEDPPLSKLRAIAQRVYGAIDVHLEPEAERTLAQFEAEGLGRLPVCVAKTPLSLSGDPRLLGAPEGFTLNVRDFRAYAGAGWLVALSGNVQQMPGLGPNPAAAKIDIDAEGRTVGLF
jgi:formate--tetrahydrofolate ligase